MPVANTPTASIIITCGPGYDRWVRDAIKSALEQEGSPEVVVVFDRCEPLNVMDPRIKVVQSDGGSPQLARKAGLAASTGDIICCLDADNAYQGTQFVSKAIRRLSATTNANPNVAGLAPMIKFFRPDWSPDRRQNITPPIKWDLERFERSNYIDTAAPVWRHALEACWTVIAERSYHEDHHMWRQLTTAGWIFVSAPELVLRYRMMPDSRTGRVMGKGYAETFALHESPVTLFIPLSGRMRLWPALRDWLAEFAASERGATMRLVLCDTSGNEVFGAAIRQEGLALPFGDVRYYRQSVGSPGLADLDRSAYEHEVQLACSRIYSRMAQEATTHLVWVIEDDILPEMTGVETLRTLLGGLATDVVSVSGVYFDRRNGKAVAWTGEARDKLQYVDPAELALHPTDYLPVFGSGFGCLLVRREVLRMIPHAVPAGEKYYDPRFFSEVHKKGLKAVLAKKVRCSHRSNPEAVSTGPQTKVIALYLPAFHRDPINDRAWGEGWTEWDNLRRWKPTRNGHTIQRPHQDIGEYDLMDFEARRKQGEIARKYDIYGFAVYHYWFGGAKALSRPWEQRLLDGEPNLPFHFVWANEPWSRIWDGSEKQLIQPQVYGGLDEWRDHAEYLRPFLEHPQYINHDGRRVLGIYRPGMIPQLTERLQYYREVLGDDLHFTSLYGTFPDHQSPACSPEFDSAIAFEPFASRLGKPPKLLTHQRIFRGACPHWDNTPRRGVKGFEVALPSFARQLRELQGEDVVYINAWNEWGEGAVLEPSKSRGYLLLKVLSDFANKRGSWAQQ